MRPKQCCKTSRSEKENERVSNKQITAHENKWEEMGYNGALK